jgi:raffinose/stachyose/melibiose transport system substrate-binding protein
MLAPVAQHHLPLPPRGRLRRRVPGPALAVVAASALLVSACSSTGSTSTSASAAGSTGGSAAAPASSAGAPASSAAAAPTTLWVQSGDGGSDALLKGYAELNKKFEAAHPGVTVKFTVKNFNDLVNTLKLQLSGSDVPDVTQVNQGYGSLGQLVTDKLVASLDDAASANTWSSRQSDSLLALDGKFSPDGKSMGSGSLYGVAATGAWVGLFMNKDAATKLGISAAPATFADLETDLAKAKAGGVTPLMYGTSDGGEPIWLTAELLIALGKPQLLTDIVNGASPSLPAETLTAAQTLKKWADAGYFTKGADAFSSNDVIGKFAKGDGLFALNGSWNVFTSASPAEAAKFTLIPFPLGAAGGGAAAIATGDLPWSVPVKGKHADLAAQYIDFITDPANNGTWIANGQVPASVSGTEADEVKKNSIVGVSADAIVNWGALQKGGTTLPFPDWATPTFYDTISKSAQSLAAGKLSPDAFVAALQKDYGAFTTKRKG